MDKSESSLSRCLRTIAAVFGIALGVMFFMANPYGLSQSALSGIGAIVVALSVAALLMEYKPWRWWVTEKRVLLGSWSVKKEGRKYLATWTFHEDGAVTVETPEYVDSGEWRFEDTCVRVAWKSYIPPENTKRCWETFFRTLKATDVHGRSWEDDRDGVPQGQGCVRANKIQGPVAEDRTPAPQPRTKGHGLPVKRQKERRYRERMKELADAAQQIDRDQTAALAWQGEVVTALQTLVINHRPNVQRFLELTGPVTDGRDIAGAMRKGEQYLRDIASMDGGDLN